MARISSRGEGCREFLEQIGRRSRHFVPCRENDPEAVTTGNTPLVVVVLVVVGVVMPASTIRLEDRALPLEGKVEAVRTTVPDQRAPEPLRARWGNGGNAIRVWKYELDRARVAQ